MSAAALVFLLIWAALILIPCIAMGWLGYRLITKLGQYPSRTPLIQKSFMFPYIVVAVASMTAIIVFFKILTAE